MGYIFALLMSIVHLKRGISVGQGVHKDHVSKNDRRMCVDDCMK